MLLYLPFGASELFMVLQSFISLLAATFGVSLVSAQAPARLVKDLNRSPTDFSAGIGWVLPVKTGVLFRKDSLATGSELWVSDGTPKGTRLLKDIWPGTMGSYPEEACQVGHKVAFKATRSPDAEELWFTDGTEVGTTKLMEIPKSDGVGQFYTLLGASGGLYFQVLHWDSNDPAELWFTDGTVEGTRVLSRSDASTGGVYNDWYAVDGNDRWCYFVCDDEDLWRSDGTVEGTRKLADILEKTGGYLSRFTVARDRLFLAVSVDWTTEMWTCSLDGDSFVRLSPSSTETWDWSGWGIPADDGMFFFVEKQAFVRELWHSDGTVSGTKELPLVNEGDETCVLNGGVLEWKGMLYFGVEGSRSGLGLWRSNGTPVGTRLVTNSISKGGSGRISNFKDGGEFLYFQVQGKEGLWEQWRTDGTASGTLLLSRWPDSNAYSDFGPELSTWNEDLFFAADRGTSSNLLWRTRNSGRGAVQLTRPEKCTASSFAYHSGSGIPYETIGGDLLVFAQSGRNEDFELWKIREKDGSMRAIWKAPAVAGGVLGFHARLGSNLIFTVRGPEGLGQVWATDGSRRGTRLVADHPELGGGYLGEPVLSGGNLYYAVREPDETGNATLWMTDGTREGTLQVVTSEGFSPSPIYDEMVDFRGMLYFLASDPEGKHALWRSDGTMAGTLKVKDTWLGVPGEKVMFLRPVGDRLSLTVRTPKKHTLWSSDGSEEGTEMIPVTYPGADLEWAGPALDLDGLQIFNGTTSHLGYQWWRSDGTPEGTYPIIAGLFGQHLFHNAPESGMAAVAGRKLFYLGMNYLEAGSDAELWVTDGTEEGTSKLKDIRPGPDGSYPRQFLAEGNSVYFTADDGIHGNELWRSDGTEAGTVMVADVEPGPLGSSPQRLKIMADRLYFTAHRNTIGRELYVVDLPADE